MRFSWKRHHALDQNFAHPLAGWRRAEWAVGIFSDGGPDGGVSAANVELKRGHDQVEVYIGGQLFTTYYFSDVAKPYLMPLRTPAGVVLSRDFPVANDVGKADPKESSFEPHQRHCTSATAISTAWISGRAGFRQIYNDHAKQAFGTWRSRMSKSKRRSRVRARFRLEDPNRRVIGEETQTYTFGGTDRRGHRL